MTNILVVDDSGVVRLSVLKMLKKEGYNTFEAANIRTVKQSSFAKDLKLKDIDIIFLDIYLDGESGFDLLEFLVNNYPEIYVVMLTGEAKKNIVQKAIDLGAKDYVIKPFDQKTVLNKIEQIIALKAGSHGESETTAGDHENIEINQQELFKDNLIKEIDRTIRTDKPFSIIEIDCDAIDDEEIKDKFFKILRSEMRDIDQIYPDKQGLTGLLLPVTDESGTEIVLEKIKSIASNINSDLDQKLNFNNLTFPVDIFAENKKLEYDKNEKYMEEVLDKFALI